MKGATVRPERISFATSGLAGTVKTRIRRGLSRLADMKDER